MYQSRKEVSLAEKIVIENDLFSLRVEPIKANKTEDKVININHNINHNINFNINSKSLNISPNLIEDGKSIPSISFKNNF